MLQKIKDFISSVKDGIIFILTPILFVFGYIYYLLSKVSTLQNQLKQTQIDKQLSDTLTKKNEAEEKANVEEMDYDTIRNLYNKQHSDSGSTDSDNGPKPAA